MRVHITLILSNANFGVFVFGCVSEIIRNYLIAQNVMQRFDIRRLLNNGIISDAVILKFNV